jgi:hypothetical protein
MEVIGQLHASAVLPSVKELYLSIEYLAVRVLVSVCTSLRIVKSVVSGRDRTLIAQPVA